eukprot:GABV01008990.1.p1 GENE.GABV01008990.1~~GABV01008990.1.p1  ORF type:complete len:165 (+),score=58.80 GABV01008990.1:284-778(+)
MVRRLERMRLHGASEQQISSVQHSLDHERARKSRIKTWHPLTTVELISAVLDILQETAVEADSTVNDTTAAALGCLSDLYAVEELTLLQFFVHHTLDVSSRLVEAWTRPWRMQALDWFHGHQRQLEDLWHQIEQARLETRVEAFFRHKKPWTWSLNLLRLNLRV